MIALVALQIASGTIPLVVCPGNVGCFAGATMPATVAIPKAYCVNVSPADEPYRRAVDQQAGFSAQAIAHARDLIASGRYAAASRLLRAVQKGLTR